MEADFSFDRGPWLISRRADFWFACGGASIGLLAAVLVIIWHGDRELDALDFVLSEFHLGATYAAIVQRGLWRRRRIDVLVIPLVILALTYVFSMSSQTVLLTSITMYAAVWHRGRQSFGVARFYQRQVNGPVSRAHDVLFRGAIYLPMLATMLAYTHLAPAEYEGQPYLAMNVGGEMTSLVGFAAAGWVIAYFTWLFLRTPAEPPMMHSQGVRSRVHPGEWWVVLAHAIAFGSGYALGASNASFLLVLAVHHEVQYLYFTYAMSRRPGSFQGVKKPGIDATVTGSDTNGSYKAGRGFRTEIEHAASFAVWPVIGFVGAVVGGLSEFQWLAPLGMGGLFCHYWLDARIWTRRLFQS